MRLRDLPETERYWALVERAARWHHVTATAIAALLLGAVPGLVISLFDRPAGTLVMVVTELVSLPVIVVSFFLAANDDARTERLRERIESSTPSP